MSVSDSNKAYSGRSRRKQTPWTVRASDVVAQLLITFGGIGTIVAVSLVFIFLFVVVAPLFFPAEVSATGSQRAWSGSSSPLTFAMDEFRAVGWLVDADGQLRAYRLETGEKLLDRALVDGVRPTAISRTLAADDMAIGAADGTVRFGRVRFTSQMFSSPDSLAPAARDMQSGQRLAYQGGILEKTPQGQWRSQQLEVEVGEPIAVAESSIRLLDHVIPSGGDLGAVEYRFACITADGRCRLGKVSQTENQFSGETSVESNLWDISYREVPNAEPFQVLIAGRGENLYVVWTNGLLRRFDIRDTDKIVLVEETQLIPNSNARVTVCGFLLGRETMIVGDSEGGLRAWFRTRHSDNETDDGLRLRLVHDLTLESAAATAWRASERSRMLVVGYKDGMLRVFHATTEKQVTEQQVAREPILAAAITPKEDGLVALTDRVLWTADFDPRHPEVTLASLFRPVWYEGYDGPLNIWQSSYSTSAPEMKLGMYPLVFGTLKATFYTMLFAAPLALLAAIYTSEFMHPRIRSVVKPTIEMMASLPSVVLGFLAALVLAPMIEQHLTSVIAAAFLTPFMFLAISHLWQAMPQYLLRRAEQLRLVALFIPLPLGIIGGWFAAPLVERRLFAGNIMRWLDGQIGSGVGAWLLLWLPLCALVMTLMVAIYVNPLIRGVLQRCTRRQGVVISLVKFTLASLAAVALAGGIAWLLNSVGWDPRGTFVDTYVQRNALVVGAVMGVAVIPIIYTIADDALSTVPQHLRSASVGCGATPWQTAFRVVVPTAMSGLFSALMIGLGRAVGETMIVLMAGGNTPVTDWNLFNGFRTLSANIAVELPEAVRDSTHYRALFFAALTLFLLTFCLNTLAEIVRLRFRRRAFQL